ncbi:MAG TPA: M50 family metallopeptidase [Nitrospirota bacterium]|nr:M50 family metallopeptidase [Nitrospirota bacterium]
MLNKTFKILLGLALVPFCIGFTWQFGSTVFGVTYKREVPYYFLAGGLTYITAHILFKKPILTYVFGHELTHAFFTMLFGGRVKSFHASDRGGRVTITKSNFIITLAPYFFPLYTFAALIMYWLAVIANVRTAAGWLVFASGTTYSFHLILTFFFLQTDQNDIKEHGAVFSYPLIYLFNILFAAFLIWLLLADNMSYPKFLYGGILKSTKMLSVLFDKLHGIIRARA